MLMLRRDFTRPRARSAFSSLRLQVLLMLIVAVLLPAVLRHPSSIYDLFRIVEIRNTMIAAALASLIGLFCFRRVTGFPGVRAFGYILPTFAVTYGVGLVIFLWFRLPYSSIYLTSSFLVSLIAMFVASYWIERFSVLRFYVVPHGNIDFVGEVPNAEWRVLSKPDLPQDVSAPIVADLRFDHAPEWERMLAEAAVRGSPVYHTKQLRESLTGRVSMEHLSENSFGSLLPNLAYRQLKRIADFVGASLLFAVLLFPMMLIALAVRLDSPGGALFLQERMGYRGRPFRMVKFRTMLARDVVQGDKARLDAMTQEGDERITRLGRILRRTRLDELPQLLNVIKGEMSLIGPRPEAVALSRWYEDELPFYFYRHIVRPGMSGWAQVHQGHVTDLNAVNEKLAYDFYYIKNFSAWLDILIALRTVAVMISGFGSK